MKVLNVYNLNIPKQGNNFSLDEVRRKFVLTSGGDGSLAVYEGVGTDDWVASHGTKLNFNQAVSYFPSLQEKDYRA